MSDDETKILENSPLLRRILESQERLEALVKTLEESIERQGYNTVPMWEQTLRELGEVKQSVALLGRKMDVFTLDVMNLRQEQLHNEQRLARIEAENEGGAMVRVN
jgi:hypothetical protein